MKRNWKEMLIIAFANYFEFFSRNNFQKCDNDLFAQTFVSRSEIYKHVFLCVNISSLSFMNI